jgi:peptidoglycan hydrolase CwlO-like protein
MNEYLSLIASAVVSVFTGIIGYLTGKKKRDAEAEQVSLGNVEQALSIYKVMLDDMKARYDAEIESLKNKLNQYEKHIDKLEKQIKELQ